MFFCYKSNDKKTFDRTVNELVVQHIDPQKVWYDWDQVWWISIDPLSFCWRNSIGNILQVGNQGLTLILGGPKIPGSVIHYYFTIADNKKTIRYGFPLDKDNRIGVMKISWLLQKMTSFDLIWLLMTSVEEIIMKKVMELQGLLVIWQEHKEFMLNHLVLILIGFQNHVSDWMSNRKTWFYFENLWKIARSAVSISKNIFISNQISDPFRKIGNSKIERANQISMFSMMNAMQKAKRNATLVQMHQIVAIGLSQWLGRFSKWFL